MLRASCFGGTQLCHMSQIFRNMARDAGLVAFASAQAPTDITLMHHVHTVVAKPCCVGAPLPEWPKWPLCA